MLGLRRRHGEDEGEKGLREGLLDRIDYDEADAPSTSSPYHETSLPAQGPLQEFLKAIGQGLTICASQLCSYIAWLLAIGNKQGLTTEQLEQVERLKAILEAKFDNEDPKHKEALTKLWAACFPNDGPVVFKSERWKDAGFQGVDPTTDFRGGGLFALSNLLYMADRHPDTFHRLMHKTDGQRAEMEYPFCVAGINITFDLQELIGLRHHGKLVNGEPCTAEGRAFAVLIAEDPHAFEELYVCTFEALDHIWLDTGASYFEFQLVIQKTLAHVRKALSAKPKNVAELRKLMLP